MVTHTQSNAVNLILEACVYCATQKKINISYGNRAIVTIDLKVGGHSMTYVYNLVISQKHN